MKTKAPKRHTDEQTAIYISRPVHARLKRIAKRDGRLLSRVAEEAVMLHIEADAKRRAASEVPA
jgi:cytidylate kinase